MSDPDLEQRAINVIRGLAMDVPQAANSGHQGTAMALAPLAHVLWTRVMSYDAEPTRLARPRPLRALVPATPRSCSTRCSTSPATASPSTTSRRSASGAQRTPGPPRGAPHRRRRGHHRPARPGLRQRRRHGASPSTGCGPASAPSVVDHHTFVICSATATSRRASATRPPRSPATSASAGSSTSTTTTTSRSTAPPSWP